MRSISSNELSSLSRAPDLIILLMSSYRLIKIKYNSFAHRLFVECNTHRNFDSLERVSLSLILFKSCVLSSAGLLTIFSICRRSVKSLRPNSSMHVPRNRVSKG
uniref:Uncharacterized protein n=1 Tax=Cacopsylla melanoneura TaxID=428564 RepID=A0A8D9AKL0_9HEMI